MNYDIPIFPTEPTSLINLILSEAITIIVAVILMRKWTIEWNKKIESEGNMSLKMMLCEKIKCVEF